MTGADAHTAPRRAIKRLALVLACLSVAVKLRWLDGLDRLVAHGAAVLYTPALDAAAGAVTFLGSSPWTLAVMGLMSLQWWRQRMPARLAAFWGAWLGGVLLQIGLRLMIAQWRPDATSVPLSTDLLMRFELAGFTSGHAFRSAYLYGWWGDVLLQRGTRRATAAAVGLGLLVFLVGATRVLLNRHWFTDVVGGWVVAALALAVTRAIEQRLSKTRVRG